MAQIDSRAKLPDFDSLWNYNDPAATEAAFRELLPAAIETGKRDYQAQLLSQIARTQGLQQQFEEAHVTLDRAESMLSVDMPVARVRVLLERGRVFNSAGDPESARPRFVKAWELSREIGEDAYAVDAAHMIAIVESGEDALGWNQRAIEVAESSDDPHARRWLGSLLNNLGWTFDDLGDFESALETFERALAFRREQGDPETIRIARWCIARTLRSLNRVNEALAVQLELESAGGDDGYVQEEIAECLLALGWAEQATPHFARAWELLSSDAWLTRDEPERLDRLRELGGLSTAARDAD